VSWEISNCTRVESCEDIMDGRREKIRIRVGVQQDAPVLTCTAAQARALARTLNRHANFINPPKKRRRR
jgi:hypothetical protein